MTRVGHMPCTGRRRILSPVTGYRGPQDRAPWWEEAACADTDPELFFPDRGEPWKAERARQVCNRCRVLNQCRDYAVAEGHLLGIWGGLTADERAKLRRARR